ncbi:MAG: hypothetical protein R2911_26100 [Caldilineaceae bacterium]
MAEPMITPDETARKRRVRTVQAALRLAGWLGARGIEHWPRLHESRWPLVPHPDNWTESAQAIGENAQRMRPGR